MKRKTYYRLVNFIAGGYCYVISAIAVYSGDLGGSLIMLFCGAVFGLSGRILNKYLARKYGEKYLEEEV